MDLPGLWGTAADVRRKRVLSRAAAVAAISGAVVTYKASPAAACAGSVGGGYNYAGQHSNNSVYDGVEAYISVPTIAPVAANASHVAWWDGLNDYSSSACTSNANGQCWIQSGIAIGSIPTAGYSVSPGVYYESYGPAGYQANWVLSFSMGSNPVFKQYYNGSSNGFGNPLFTNAVGNGSTTTTLQPNVPLISQYQYVQAGLEVYDPINACPNPSLQYFGSDGVGNYNSTNRMQNRGNGFGWSEWTGSITQNGFWGFYQYNLLHANSMFSTT